ncbi:MAG: methylmalonyl Co-A mutase-associated GTPase MeaB [Rhodobiaceae bacterium]|nr:methylmalonyl Co-A mutase-associated GTPase MeaB [Rhodobiaceae bacterium]MCC0054698.1 methylmalonyl Co-A mutase-associated GTPase MeaB [Rhodobiaceae bacterium]
MKETAGQAQFPGGLTLKEAAAAIAAGDRAVLARAITLVESRKPAHRTLAAELIDLLKDRTGQAVRIGISGPPGVGKSTTIDQFGMMLLGEGRRVAVLAVDPSSAVTGGSILGDKTRMTNLAMDSRAFIRPSPSAGTLGGVAARTRETMLLCEAAGYDAVIVETVGTGQSETAVADMVDIFLVLLLPGGGDELQGIKKGIIELADILAINKADGDNAPRAKATASEYRAALHILTPRDAGWHPPVLTIAGLTGLGLDELWTKILEHRDTAVKSGAFERRRRAQQVKWMWTMLEDRIHARLTRDPATRARVEEIEAELREGARDASSAVEEIAGILGV